MSANAAFALFMTFSLCESWKSNRTIEAVGEGGEYEVDVFCKNKNRLIRFESNAEFYPVDAYVNSSILMQCKYCEERDDGLPKTWNRQKRIFSGNVTEVELSMEKKMELAKVFVDGEHSLVIRNVRENDTGTYFCKAPYVDSLEKSFNYLLDVMNRSAGDVTGNLESWKNYSESVLLPLNRRFAAEGAPSVSYMKINLTVFTDWSEWSECDSCSAPSTQTRIGRCRVKPAHKDPGMCGGRLASKNDTFFDEKHNTEVTETAASAVLSIEKICNIISYSISLSCRSYLLKSLLPRVYEKTSSVPDFVLVAKCRGKCRGRKSPKGAHYRRSILLAEGAHLTLVCPDSNVDSDVRWEHNKARLYPNEGFDYIQGSEEPRIYVDSFNTLYLFEVTEEESGNFTCFVEGIRMQEVNVVVIKRSVFFTKEFRRHLNYLAIVFLICFVAYLSGVAALCVRTRREERSRVARRPEESEKLLDDYDSG